MQKKKGPNHIIDVRQVGPDTLKPILFLLQSHDIEVQRASSAALGNLAVNSKMSPFFFIIFFIVLFNILPLAENKLLIVRLGGLDQLIRQMASPNVEVQCNAVGCITNLATHGKKHTHTHAHTISYKVIYNHFVI